MLNCGGVVIHMLRNSDKKNGRVYFLLHILLLLLSFTGIFSKLASKEEFLSIGFLKCYTPIIIILAIYAIGWQQVIKRLPLSIAYANKAVGLIWGIIIGRIIFNEGITLWKVAGAIIIIIGIVVFSLSNEDNNKDGQ